MASPTTTTPTTGQPVWRNRKTLIGAGIAAAVLIGTVTAVGAFVGDPSFSTPSGDVVNAKEFLIAANQQWRQDLTSTQANQMNLSKDGACYYVEQPGTQMLTGSVACGPVRRATAPAGQVWDLYSFQTAVQQDGATLVHLSSRSSSAARPAGQLLAADGSQPAKSADSLALPPLPSAPATLSQSYDLAEGESVDGQPSLAGAVLHSPVGTLTLTAAGTLGSASVSADQGGDPVVMKAAQGYELRYFAWKVDSPEGGSTSTCVWSCPQAPTSSLTLIVGSHRTDLGAANGSGGWLMSLPKGTDAQLALTVGTKELRTSVVSGKTAEDPQEALYSLQNGTYAASKNIATWHGSYDDDGFPDKFTYDLSVSDVTLTPYDTDKGWAPAGKAWLEVSASDNCSGSDCSILYKDWTVTVDGARSPLSVDRLTGKASGTQAFLVPVTTRSAQLHLQSKLVVTNIFGAAAQSFHPTALTATASFS